MNSTVPEGWSIESLAGNVDILSGFPFKSSLFCDDSSRMGVIRIRDLAKQRLETFYKGEFDEAYIVCKGDILIGMDGDFNIVKWKARDALLNQRICKVKASLSGVFNSDFLFYSLVDDLDAIHSATGATTVKHLSVKDIRVIEKAYPPLREQQKIATILSSVDNVIETTRAQIDKLKDLKTGMMQELLTKGIGSGGVPHTKFKDSPVGRIPVGWGVIQIRDLQAKGKYSCVGGPFGSDLTSKHYIDVAGVPVIRGANLPLDFNRFFDDGFVYVSENKADSLFRNMAYRGDFIFTQRGTIGQVGLVPDNSRFERYVVSQSQMKLTIDEIIVNKEFLYQFFLSNTFLRMLKLETISTGLPHINLGILKSFPVPFPPLMEQEKIGKLLFSVDEKMSRLNKKHSQFKLLKKALMQDLLTGKVRVKIEDNEKEPAVA